MCTLHRALTPPVEAAHTGAPPTSPKRNYFLVLIGFVQILLAFFLLRTVSLAAATAVPLQAAAASASTAAAAEVAAKVVGGAAL
jgi:hypothetical protein